MTKTLDDVLVSVEELLATPEQWTQRAAARDQFGNPVVYFDRHARCFCLDGAVERTVLRETGYDVRRSLRREFRERLRLVAGGNGVVAWNDHPGRTHAQVLDLLRKMRSISS